MEGENLEVSAEYKKWFNRGYELSKSMPEVFKGVKTPQNQPKEITQAFEAGRKQFEIEQGMNRDIDEQRDNLKSQYLNKDRNSDRGR